MNEEIKKEANLLISKFGNYANSVRSGLDLFSTRPSAIKIAIESTKNTIYVLECLRFRQEVELYYIDSAIQEQIQILKFLDDLR